MFFAVPTGLDRGLKRRPLLAVIVFALILYRCALSLGFPTLNLRILLTLPGAEVSTNLISAAIQSAFTPALPAGAPAEHQWVLVIGILAVLVFWLMFGPALEDSLGRRRFAILYGAGVLAGVPIAASSWFAVTEAFWLGHTAALAAIGMCYSLFVFSDVRVRYAFWIPLISAGDGHLELPAVLFLVPIHLVLFMTQSAIWYTEAGKYAVVFRPGVLDALGWQVLVSILGGIVGFLIAPSGKSPAARADAGKKQVSWGA
ncbi:MAG: rhomboid family intramembrane serine protease [Candidatus Sumerlaeia bacterium]|nr:rhomboid family intramembrane serine protease [Candidatus Sumerlaeia bacterium]